MKNSLGTILLLFGSWLGTGEEDIVFEHRFATPDGVCLAHRCTLGRFLVAETSLSGSDLLEDGVFLGGWHCERFRLSALAREQAARVLYRGRA